MATRKYELKKRAERQAQTRQRIVEAAVDLHSTVGPLKTTISGIAERAGVQRHTVYSHFPDERSLYYACSGLYIEQNPLPDAEQLLRIDDGETRLRRAVELLYRYYEQRESLLNNVVRDAEVHELTREVFHIRIVPALTAIQDAVAAGIRPRAARRQRVEAAIEVALDFRTWQTLVRRRGLDAAQAVETAVAMVRCQPAAPTRERGITASTRQHRASDL